MTDTAIQTIETPPVPAHTPARLLELAVTQGANVDQLGKLMDLQQRWDAENARKAFFAAKAQFQAICPKITKDKKVKYGNTEYEHASLAHIADMIREPLQQCGLSYDWEFSNTAEGGLQVTCVLSHVEGHSQRNPLTAPPDDSGAKNVIQQYGSTATYLQRYTLIGVLGLSSVDQDDDGQSSGATNVETLRAHNDAVREHFLTVYAVKMAIAGEDWSAATEAWYELSQDEQRALWLAPTKGGIFTTREREAMKSTEWAEAHKANRG